MSEYMRYLLASAGISATDQDVAMIDVSGHPYAVCQLLASFQQKEFSMSNQPQNTPKGQIPANTGATPPSRQSVISKAVDPSKGTQNMKRIAHNAKIDRHNSGVSGNNKV